MTSACAFAAESLVLFEDGVHEELHGGTEFRRRKWFCVVSWISVCCGDVYVFRIGAWLFICNEVETVGRVEPLQFSYSLWGFYHRMGWVVGLEAFVVYVSLGVLKRDGANVQCRLQTQRPLMLNGESGL